MLFILTVMLCLLALAAYKLSGKEICSPSVLFTVPFIIMCIVALLFSKEWSFELHFTTFIMILLGCVSFCVGTVFGGKMGMKSCGQNCTVANEREVKPWKYVVMLIFQLCCYIIKLKCIINFGTAHGVSNNLGKCIVYYNNQTKFTTSDLSGVFPGWLSLALDVCAVFGFICACILAQQILLKHRDREHILLLSINYALALAGGLTSGGRGGAVQLIIVFLCAYLILFQRECNWKKTIPLKKVLFIGLVLCAAVYLFMQSLYWVGRNAVYLVGRYLSNYIGAQIFNLDYVVERGIEYSKIFGQETFYPIIEKISKIFGISKWAKYHVGYDSIYAAGYNTGNVFTCFYNYYKDFGMFGVIVLPMIFGAISQVIYRHARKSPNLYSINLGLTVYSVLSYMIIFGFFADKFGGIFFTFNMIKRIILLYILNYFLYQSEFKNGKVVMQGRIFGFKFR